MRGMVICGILVNGVFMHPVSVGLNINYTVIFRNFACINIFIIGNRGFTKNLTEKQFYRQVLFDSLISM